MVDMDARQKAGIRPSTSEVKTHIAMMKSVGVNACIHAHPPHCNAFLFAGQVPPSGINPEADIFLGHIPLAPYGTPGSLETARAVAEAAKQSTVVFMENHGVITGARDVEEAEWFMENADAYCRMVLMAGLHKAPLNQVGPEGVADFLAIRKSIGYAVLFQRGGWSSSAAPILTDPLRNKNFLLLRQHLLPYLLFYPLKPPLLPQTISCKATSSPQ